MSNKSYNFLNLGIKHKESFYKFFEYIVSRETSEIFFGSYTPEKLFILDSFYDFDSKRIGRLQLNFRSRNQIKGLLYSNNILYFTYNKFETSIVHKEICSEDEIKYSLFVGDEFLFFNKFLFFNNLDQDIYKMILFLIKHLGIQIRIASEEEALIYSNKKLNDFYTMNLEIKRMKLIKKKKFFLYNLIKNVKLNMSRFTLKN